MSEGATSSEHFKEILDKAMQESSTLKLRKRLQLKEKFRKERIMIETYTESLNPGSFPQELRARVQEGFLDPRLIFPLEIWEHIFSYIEPSDVYHVARTCPGFEDIVKRLNPLLHLPEVLSILLKKDYVSVDWHRRYQERIWNLREVSKWCTFSYDRTFYERRFSSEQWHLDLDWNRPTRMLDFFHSGRVEEFISAFTSAPILRVPTKCVFLDFWWRNELINIALDTFFELFGGSVWYLHVKLATTKRTYEDIYTKLSSWAIHLANLKVLIIESNGIPALAHRYEAIKFSGQTPALPFPTIPSLTVYREIRVPFSLFSKNILGSNPGIKYLGTLSKPLEGEKSSTVLRSLAVERYEYFDDFKFRPVPDIRPPIFQSLEDTGGPWNWSLKQITLKLRFNAQITLGLLRFLNQFKSTLQDISLRFEAGEYSKSEVPSNLLLDLPKVKHFRFDSFVPHLLPCHWIYSMRSLEILEVSSDSAVRSVRNRYPHMNCFPELYPCWNEEKVGDFSLWEFFPKLREVRFKSERSRKTSVLLKPE